MLESRVPRSPLIPREIVGRVIADGFGKTAGGKTGIAGTVFRGYAYSARYVTTIRAGRTTVTVAVTTY